MSHVTVYIRGEVDVFTDVGPEVEHELVQHDGALRSRERQKWHHEVGPTCESGLFRSDVGNNKTSLNTRILTWNLFGYSSLS